MFRQHAAGRTTYAVMGGRLVLTHTFADGVECAEEYDASTATLLARRWREERVRGVARPAAVAGGGAGGGGAGAAYVAAAWEYEFGEPPPAAAAPAVVTASGVATSAAAAAAGGKPGSGGAVATTTTALAAATGLLSESAGTPFVVRGNKPSHWEWRVRNVPWPGDVYSVTVDAGTEELVVRTSNRKYFKRLPIPSMRRAGLPLAQSAVRWEHDGSNTLVIRYAKPEPIVAMEAAEVAAVREKLATAREGDAGCKSQ